MTLIHEDGSGKADAEAFVSVADATAYHAKFGNPSSWTAAATADQETALRTATRFLEASLRGMWIGRRYLETQALAWPRSDAWDEDGYLIAYNVVPPAVKDACSVLALAVIDGDSLLAAVDGEAPVTSESVSIGPISISQDFAGVKPVEKQYPLVDELLRPLLLPPGGIVRS